jgi:hypothetical protein
MPTWLDRLLVVRRLTAAPISAWLFDGDRDHLVAATGVEAPTFVISRPDDIEPGVDVGERLNELTRRIEALEAAWPR